MVLPESLQGDDLKKIHEQFLQLLDPQLATSLTDFGGTFSLQLTPELWQSAASIASKLNYRFVAIWAQDLETEFQIDVCLELCGSYLLLRTAVSVDKPSIPSFTPYFAGANRLERHTHDMFGIEFTGHPDPRRWTRHMAWREDQFPLQKNFLATQIPTTVTPPDNSYPFKYVAGVGVYEIPVGPIHAGIIEPGHFRFHAAGEDVISLEERLGYKHKGVEKIAEGRSVNQLVKVAGRVSGDSTVAYAWSACKAIESALKLEVPKRASIIRAIMCEHERIANHIGDFAGICNDVAYTFGYYQLMRLKEYWLRMNAQVFGHRFMMDCIIPSGVCADLSLDSCQIIREQIISLKSELVGLYPVFEDNSGFHDRIKTTGILSTKRASNFGVLGFVGRASGKRFDLRHDAACCPYDELEVSVPVFHNGDVLARSRIRAQEILVSFDLVMHLLDMLSESGKLFFKEDYEHFLKSKTAVEGIGLVEGWRGEILTYVRLSNNGIVERYFPRDPSWFSWPALEQLIYGNIVPDFPVCNKSINGSYSAVDL